MSKTFSLNGIRGRLLLLLLIVLIPVLLIETFTFYRRFESRKSEEFQANLEVARGAAKSFDTFIQDLVRSELVIGLALTPSQPVTGRDRNRILDQFQANHPAVRSIFWMNAHGLVIASSLRSYVGYDLGDRSFFQRVKEGRKWAVSELIVGRATGKPGFTVSCGIRNEQGKLLGVVAASVEPDRLDSVLGIERSTGAGVSLLDNKGMIVFRYPPIEYTWEQRNLLKQYPMIEDSLKGKEVLTSLLAESTGRRRLAAFTPVSSIGWVAAAGRAEDEAIKTTTSAILFEAGLVLFVTFVGFGAAMAFAHPISSSIIGLRNQALALGRGEMENLTIASGPDELKDLAVAFKQMGGEVRQREAALRESEQRWATTLASIGDAVIATDLSGKITFMNKVAEELTGWPFSEASAKPVADIFHIINEHTRNRVEDPVAKVLKEGVIVGLANHTVLVGKSGKEIPIDDSGAPIRGQDGKPMGVVLIFRDITARKQAEETVQTTFLRFFTVLSSMYTGLLLVTDESRVEFANQAFCDYFELNDSPEDLMGLSSSDIFTKISKAYLYPDEAIARIKEIVDREQPVKGEEVAMRTGHELLRDFIPIRINGKSYGRLWYHTDITERKRAEEALQQRTLELQHLTETLEERVKERTAELATLSSELLVAQERERKRISYNLHDNVWQTLEIIKSQLEILFSRENEADWPAFHRKAKQLTPVIRDTIARVRSMQGDLWPSVLDDIGIVATLEWYCREFETNHSGLSIEKNVGLTEEDVPASAKIVIYRVMQEALNNVAKHSQASHVSLSLIKSDHRLEFFIRDNGVGFDPEEAIVKRSPWGGLGLRSMRERTELSGGLFGVESAKGKGTTVRASWLLSGNNSEKLLSQEFKSSNV